MKITIENHHFDTEKARRSWSPSYWDGSNNHHAELYLSSTGILYGNSLSQWGNGHGSFEILTVSEALEQYDRALTETEKKEIAEVGGVTWE
jgi:hypothetical protein